MTTAVTTAGAAWVTARAAARAAVARVERGEGCGGEGGGGDDSGRGLGDGCDHMNHYYFSVVPHLTLDHIQLIYPSAGLSKNI